MRTKPNPNNAERLRTIMKRLKLRRADVAEVAVVSIKTVDTWLAKPEASNYRAMPDRAIELVELKLRGRKAA